MYFVAGTAEYGRVKTAGRLPIVAKCSMLQLFPAYPVRSYYRFHRTPFRVQPTPTSKNDTAPGELDALLALFVYPERLACDLVVGVVFWRSLESPIRRGVVGLLVRAHTLIDGGSSTIIEGLSYQGEVPVPLLYSGFTSGGPRARRG
jgi:hypothetical protein